MVSVRFFERHVDGILLALATRGRPGPAGVSCAAGTFARDAAVLIGGGYRLERVTPVDQFAWSGHVELVGIFRKDARKPRGRLR